MPGDNPSTIDLTIRDALPRKGYREDVFNLPLATWIVNNAGTFTALTFAAGTLPFRTPVNAGTIIPMEGIRWDNGAAAVPVQTGFRVPAYYDRDVDELFVLAVARYSGTGVDGTPKITCSAEYFLPGTTSPNIANTAAPSTTAPAIGLPTRVVGDATTQTINAATATARTITDATYLAPGSYANNYLLQRQVCALAAAGGAGVPTNFDEYAFNLSLGTPGRLTPGTSNINVIKPGTFMTISLAPSAAVGANNNLDIIAVTVRMRRNASMASRQAQYGYDRLRDTVA